MTYTQKLIDARGYGNAEKQLKKDGNWDEWAGLPVKTWRVTYRDGRLQRDNVYARTEFEAARMFLDDNITVVKIEEIKE